MPANDPELVAIVAAGDSGAYGELYRRHVAVARCTARRLAPSRPDAEDLVSQAFVNVLHVIQRGRRPDPFRAYLLCAIYTDAYKLTIQRRRCRVAGPPENWEAGLRLSACDTDPATRLEHEPIRQAFRSLPPRWRLALWLSAVEGRPPTELGSLLDLNANGAAALTFRARRGFRQALTTRSCR